MSSNSSLTKFLAAMQRIYAFPLEPATSWTPPPATAGHRGRYLWTDAFGVLNFLTLHRLTKESVYLTHARTLVSTVHQILGRTRDLSSRLPGADDSNPLRGGLRIGKEDAAGPDGDGQYHHYLTLWTFALNCLSTASGDRSYNDQAVSLAKAIHPHFVYNRTSDRSRMYWKMSTDLQKPLVRSEGNLDPIDGLVVFKLLQRADGPESKVLEEEIADYGKIVRTKWGHYESSDPLDLGMTLWTAHWFASDEPWAQGLLNRARSSLGEFLAGSYFARSTPRRLAFREFGLALGMKCDESADHGSQQTADDLLKEWEIAGVVPGPGEEALENANTEPALSPITATMYAAALIPGVFQKDALQRAT